MNSLEMNNIEEIKTLNSYQQEAVLDESPACLVNANVGSGKTTVLIEKVRHLALVVLFVAELLQTLATKRR